MNKLRISPLLPMLLFAYMLIEGSFDPLWVLLFSILHELGHLGAIRLLGGRVCGLTGSGQGFGLQVNGLSYRSEFIVAMAGPLVSLLLAALFYILQKPFFCYSNLALGLLNLLPILPLDGGRMLRAILASYLQPYLQQRLMQALEPTLLLPLLALAFWQFLKSGYNLSLLLICFYLLSLLGHNE